MLRIWASLCGDLGQLAGSIPGASRRSDAAGCLGKLCGWLGTSKKNPGLNGTFVTEHKEGEQKALPAAVAVWRRSPHGGMNMATVAVPTGPPEASSSGKKVKVPKDVQYS